MHILILFYLVYITSYIIDNLLIYNIFVYYVNMFYFMNYMYCVIWCTLRLCIIDLSMNTHDRSGLAGKCHRDSLLPQGSAHLACKRPHMQSLVWPPPIMPGG